ncbi:hypothetical protein AHF37_01435 [Paragonimus kellicotti]|nr:hypothetical protein AHF37_01435 [Paragonimus kellicotti]
MAHPLREESPIIRIAHYHYVHILNLNTNVIRLVLGPKTYVCLQDEKIVVGPTKMISLSPMEYCVIRNPVMVSEDGDPILDVSGQAKLRVGDKDYRFYQEPFPLHPGEELEGPVKSLPIVHANAALHLQALVDFVDDGVRRIAGEEWLFEGPGTYYPRKEVELLKPVQAVTIEPNSALCLKALKDCVDRSGNARVYGEKWLVYKPGVYLPGPYEEVVEVRTAYKLTDKVALHVRALQAHVDKFQKKRRFGDEWLITSDDADSHICGVFEEVVSTVDITVLEAHKYCVILNPVDASGVPQLGKKLLVRGEQSFFLKPGESLECGVVDSYILEQNEGLILRAEDRFEDELPEPEEYSAGSEEALAKPRKKIIRQPGDHWMIRGPMEYVPPVHVTVFCHRNLIPLDRNEGVYVRNNKTGVVRAVIGQAYMLNQDEELWEKKLPADVIQLLTEGKDPLGDRGSYAQKRPAPTSTTSDEPLDMTRVVSFQVPHNAAVQVYDYRDKRARVEFGPTLVMLGPDEQFTKLSLSGGKPKRPNMIKSLCLLLGPDFCTDVVVLETADHARLSLQLSYNWHFNVPHPCSQAEAAKLFSVPDFIGDACKAIASRIRGTVASVNFDDFHRNSARIIRTSVFGLDENGHVKDLFVFPQNNLHITSIDVQSVEPVDQRTRDSLQKSVQLAIEITTNSQEAAARHEAERLEQEARGRLERQRIEDETAAEVARSGLLETKIKLAALESTGQATSEAQSRAEAARIEGEAAVERAKLHAQAMAIETDAELERLKKARQAELEYISEKDQLKLKMKTEEMKIEVSRFTAMVNSIGAETIKSIANAGSEHNLRMLSALGLQSTLITDGTTPVNLLSTAHGLIGQMMDQGDYRLAKPPRKPLSKPTDTALATRDKREVVAEDDDDESSVVIS